MRAVLRLMHRFADMKYYKEMAKLLEIEIVPIGKELELKDEEECEVQGLKVMQTLPHPEINQTNLNQNDKENENIAISSEIPQIKEESVNLNPINPPYSQKTQQPLYSYDKQSKCILPFSSALTAASFLNLDLLLLFKDQTPPILTLSPYRLSIYRKYYQNHIAKNNKKSTSKQKYDKMLKIGANMGIHDIENKMNTIERLRKEGHRIFKLQAIDDGDRAEKALISFAKFFDQNVQTIIEHYKEQKTKVKPVKKLQRHICFLRFTEQIDINVETVNKKWQKRLQIERLRAQGKLASDRPVPDLDLSDYTSDQESQLLREMIRLSMPLPKKYSHLQDIAKQNFSRDSIIKQALQKVEQRMKEGSPDDIDPEEERLRKQKLQKINKSFANQRRLEDVLEQMEELKESGYEEEAWKLKKYQKLEQQVKEMLKNARPSNDI